MNYNIETLAINTIRTLSIDAINQANSGHPGLPMGGCSHGVCIMGASSGS
ncbi:hypothetical protein GCM10020331_084280 [Ectobacillus funiculus]